MNKLALVTCLFTAICVGQTPPNNPDTIQALLVEVRGLRHDIESMTVASQRVQIALYGLQIQDGAVARSAQRLDDARNRRRQAEEGRDHMASEIQMMEVRFSHRTGMETPDELKQRELSLTQMKSELDKFTVEAQSRTAAEAELTSQFRTEQAKLTELQDRIERLDKVLEKLGVPAK